jgi:hypothetical protein
MRDERRKSYIIGIFFLLLFISGNQARAQEVSIQLHTQPAWPPGKDVPVTLEVLTGGIEGFARFYQSLPLGFKASELQSSGADFYWDNNQVNLVWTKLPDNERIRVSYLVKADAALSGSFRLDGRLDYVIEGKERHSVELNPQMIKLEKGVRVEEYDMPDSPVVTSEPEDSNKTPVKVSTEKPDEMVVFRVQVAISSEKFGKDELEGRLNCRLEHGITVLEAGSMYKYQTGAFSRYSQAEPYLASLKELGVKDSFIVAFRGSEQIAISLARTLTE